MSNNRLWKRKLQDKIDEHNHQHGRKPKGVSNKTMHERASSLIRSFGLLRRLGYQIDPNSLAGRHVQVLVDYWTCNARIADLCGFAAQGSGHVHPAYRCRASILTRSIVTPLGMRASIMM